MNAQNKFNSINFRSLVLGLLLFGFTVPVMAQQSPVPTFEPIKKKMCRHKKKLYVEKTILEINGKDYKCTQQGWVLMPT